MSDCKTHSIFYDIWCYVGYHILRFSWITMQLVSSISSLTELEFEESPRELYSMVLRYSDVLLLLEQDFIAECDVLACPIKVRWEFKSGLYGGQSYRSISSRWAFATLAASGLALSCINTILSYPDKWQNIISVYMSTDIRLIISTNSVHPSKLIYTAVIKTNALYKATASLLLSSSSLVIVSFFGF